MGCKSALIAVLALAGLAAPGSALATSIRWGAARHVESPANGGLSDVACPSSALCVAVDQSGYVLTSTRPGAGVWSRTVRIDPGGTPLTAISCASTRLCVAVDANGSVVSSTNPTGGAKFWSRPAHIDSTIGTDGGPAGLADVACPSPVLCVAVDAGNPGKVFTSTNPTGGARAWRAAPLTGSLLTSVACTSVSLCVLGGSQHWYATSPTGGATAWHPTGPPTGGGVLSDVACPSVTLCAGVGFGDLSVALVDATTRPTGPVSDWTTVDLQPSFPNLGAGLLDGVGCLSGSFCVAVDSSDNAYTSSAPGRGLWGAPAVLARASAPTATSSAISCTTTLCVVVDSGGYAVAGTRSG